VALVCLAVVARLRPDWVAVKLGEAAVHSGVSPQRLSRLCSRAIAPFEAVVGGLTRMGRPPGEKAAEQVASQRDLMAALLDIATSLLSHCRLRGPLIRSLVVGAWLRLHAQHPKLTRKSFCEALTIPERTFRHWLKTERPTSDTKSKVETPKPKKPNKRPLRRGRFSFAVTLPDTQMAADTTDLCAFRQPLKLIAAQDIGGRDTDLLDAVIVEDHESAKLVSQVLTEAVQDIPQSQALQVLTDQGTPYMAQLTRDLLEQLEMDHAPQREGDPLGKATVERAFATIKQIARPLLAITDRIADAIEALRNVELAKALTTVLLTALLRAYQAGARAAHRAAEARGELDEQALVRAAQNSRQQAHAEDRSARMLLEHIHSAYQIGGPVAEFIRAFRRCPLLVLHRAERAFGAQAHRDDIRDRKSYFAAIVRRIADEHRTEQAIKQRQDEEMDERRRQAAKHKSQLRHWTDNPGEQLQAALGALAAQWHPSSQSLLFDGVGLGSAWLKDSLERLRELHGAVAASDIASGTFDAFARQQCDPLGPAGIAAIEATLRDHLRSIGDCAHRFAGANLKETGPPSRPDPSPLLRT
jgi:transposase InsO family protein